MTRRAPLLAAALLLARLGAAQEVEPPVESIAPTPGAAEIPAPVGEVPEAGDDAGEVEAGDDAGEVEAGEVAEDEDVAADGFVEPSESALSGADVDPEAIAAWELTFEGKWGTARELAETVLRRDPDSYAGHLVLGHVLHLGEGDLPRARYHLLRARRLFEARYRIPAPPDSPWRWHLLALEKLASVDGEMDLFEERIADLKVRDELYEPRNPAEYGWSYMRLGRYAEAKQSVVDALEGGDERQQAIARTALCALEFEMKDRARAYEACTEAARFERDGDGHPAPFSNAGSASLGVLKMDEGERWFLECSDESHFETDSPTNPWISLTDLYVAQGRAGEARDALFEALRWRAMQAPNLDEQTWAETQLVSALFLLAVGRPEDAARLASRTLARPDRTGFVSADPDRILSGAAILDAVAQRVAGERAAEAASFSRWRDWPGRSAELLSRRVGGALSARRAAAVVAGDDVLVASMRPYLGGGILIPVWLSPEIVRTLGAGVAGAAVARARAEETLPEAAPYLDALAAESAYLQGDEAGALELARAAIAALPGSELMLAARLHGLAGLAAEASGDLEGALAHWDQAVQRDPGVVRLLGIRLPCRIEAPEEGIAARAATMLARSPRFRDDGEGFVLRVEGGGDDARACLGGIAGRVVQCAEIARKRGETDADAARRLAAAFHETAFAPRVELTQADLKSLDGGTMASGVRKMEGLLELLGGKSRAAEEKPVEEGLAGGESAP